MLFYYTSQSLDPRDRDRYVLAFTQSSSDLVEISTYYKQLII